MERKFIEVKVTTDLKLAMENYTVKKNGLGDHTALVTVGPHDFKILWTDHPGEVKGKEKVVNFLVWRNQLMRDAGIPENPLLEVSGKRDSELLHRIFCCTGFNDKVDA
jgi:hypothetical protein